jgi:uncharacterized membrane protein YtjA (UPF0391 family)
MIHWSFISFCVALAAGLFGFGGSTSAAAGLAQALFFAFLALAVALVGVKLARDASGPGDEVKDAD